GDPTGLPSRISPRDFSRPGRVSLDNARPRAQSAESVRALSRRRPVRRKRRVRNPEGGLAVGGRTMWKRGIRLSAVLVALVLAACSSSNATDTSSGSSPKPITLRVDLFGDFGYHDLYKQFEQQHPNVTIKEDIEQYADHHNNLVKHLAAGSGAD